MPRLTSAIRLLCKICIVSNSCCKTTLFFLRYSSVFTASGTSEFSINLQYGALPQGKLDG